METNYERAKRVLMTFDKFLSEDDCAWKYGLWRGLKEAGMDGFLILGIPSWWFSKDKPRSHNDLRTDKE